LRPAGVAMKKKIMAAMLDMAEHVIEHDELCSTIPEEMLTVWTEQFEDWKRDLTHLNPFDNISEGTWSSCSLGIKVNNKFIKVPCKPAYEDNLQKMKLVILQRDEILL
jgi:hypothetical protein